MVHGPGLDRFIEAQVDALALHGFVAAAPDVFHRQPDDGADTMARIARLVDDEILADVDEAVAHLRTLTTGPLAVIGFCMGGRNAYLAAAARPGVWSAAGVFYGGNITKPWGGTVSPFDRTARIACPLVGFFGKEDTNPSPADVAALSAELSRHGVGHTFRSYPDAGHAFLNFTNPERHRPAAAADAWSRLLAFLDRELGRTPALERPVYGTADPASPITRAELERALRNVNLGYVELRDGMLEIGARLIALTDELTRRLDRVEPLPAPPNTPAPAPTTTIEMGAHGNVPTALVNMRAADAGQPNRVTLDLEPIDKYTIESPAVPCEELLPICKARCCRLSFAISTQDLDEGVIQFDYGQPYMIRQRKSDGYCVHNDPHGHGCTVHGHRPRVCRRYDCRTDDRIWADYEKRIPATPVNAMFERPEPEPREVELSEMLGRVQQRQEAIAREKASLAKSFQEIAPTVGPPPKPRAP